ncbi:MULTISPECIES: class F sortase [unclassified Nonomuraea]|uniref:class F sortase n=1 Tax=Nonomuraea sp. NPDC003804 TaxID=3154547 RepID=UPI0033AF9261
MTEQKSLLNKALPGLLIAGSLGGVAAIMAGLLSFITPVDDGSGPTPSLAQGESPETLAMYNVANSFVLPAVGPGGPNKPLAPAVLSAPPPAPAGAVAAPIKPNAKAKPLRIRIPKIKVNALVGSVTVDAKGELQAPPLSKPNLTGWYRFSPVPGEKGPAIINGHATTKNGAAVFRRLKELAKGDQIYVYRTDGKVTRFTVSGIEQVKKSAFPTKRVYGNVDNAQLRLITCGGLVGANGHYEDNVVVYAALSKKKG